MGDPRCITIERKDIVHFQYALSCTNGGEVCWQSIFQVQVPYSL